MFIQSLSFCITVTHIMIFKSSFTCLIVTFSTIDSADIPQTSSDEAETTEDAYSNPADHELVESLAQCQVPGKGIDEQIRTAVGAEQEQVTLKWPERHNRPASEWEPGYFSMALG